MSDLRKAAEMAMEALDCLPWQASPIAKEATQALRQALAEPEQRGYCTCGNPEALGMVHFRTRPCIHYTEHEPDEFCTATTEELMKTLGCSDEKAKEIHDKVEALAQPEQEQPKHWSDCSVYNEPAYPNGECDCGGFDLNNKWHGLTEEEAEKLSFDVIVGGVSKALSQPEQECVAIVNESMGGIEWLSPPLPDDTPLYTAPLSIEAAVLAEREACAKVCETMEWPHGYECAAAIRARGEA